MITIEMLKSWSPCAEGFRRFCELFPNGTDLETAGRILAGDGHPDWGLWLYNKCKENGLFEFVTAKGYLNSGNRNSGCRNSGDANSGDANSGDANSGDWNSGDANSGDWNSGDANSGDWNSGCRNSGNANSGDWNSGDANSGDANSGHANSGDANSGDWNSGDANSGCRNSGNANSGDANSGDWNSGNRNSGYFNTNTPEEIIVFNKLCLRSVWDASYKPKFLKFDICYWVSDSEMTDDEKIQDPQFYIRGGQLRKKYYKEAFKESWNNADLVDREKVRDLPNFDADVFFEISGIDLRL